MLKKVLTLLFLVGSAAAQENVIPPSIVRAARLVEPDAHGRPDRIDGYLEWFRRELMNDHRLFAFEVTCQWVGERTVELEGFIQFSENRAALAAFLEQLGFQVRTGRLQTTDDGQLTGPAYGLVKVAHALALRRPPGMGEREVVTECLLGDPVYLLWEAEPGQFLCHTAEGYLGFLDGHAIHRIDARTWDQHLERPKVLIREDFSTPAGHAIPLGARLPLVSTGADGLEVLLPDGSSIEVPTPRGLVHDQRYAAHVERVLENARRCLGTPYLWGGKSRQGIDCSGLVQIAFAAEGVHFPRDSNQQVYLGQLTATRQHRSALRPGDTLYFLGPDGKIRHTGIYLGDQQYIHAVMPRVCIASFHPEHANYDLRRDQQFAFGKRLLER